MSRKLLPLLFSLLAISAAGQKFSIRGQVSDTLKAAMPSATVMLLQAKDSALVTFSSTDRQGNFELKNVSRGDYNVKVTFVGYATAVKILKAGDFTTPVVELGRMTLEPISKELEALVVKGEKAPVTVKRDTIEFNAGSFKTKTNANVEDLLKKMPGMEVADRKSVV